MDYYQGGRTYMKIGLKWVRKWNFSPSLIFFRLSVCLSLFTLSLPHQCVILLLLSLGCQVQFYDIPGRRYHISKAYDQVTRSLDECRSRCAGDSNCWALMHYNTSNLCALTNLTVVFGYGCDYCFSAKKGNCIQRK